MTPTIKNVLYLNRIKANIANDLLLQNNRHTLFNGNNSGNDKELEQTKGLQESIERKLQGFSNDSDFKKNEQ